MLVVDDETIASARGDLLGQGIWVEPTAAAVWADVRNLGMGSDVRTVVNLSGAGFKASV